MSEPEMGWMTRMNAFLACIGTCVFILSIHFELGILISRSSYDSREEGNVRDNRQGACALGALVLVVGMTSCGKKAPEEKAMETPRPQTRTSRL